MNFSKRYKNTVLPSFSKCGKLIATANGSKVLVRDVASLQVLHMWVCYDCVREVAWSHDSCYLATVSGSSVQIWSLTDPVWRSAINESDSGIQTVMWSPDSRHILVLHDFSLFITIWALEYGTQMYIKNAKSPQTIQFSPDGKYLALIERTDCTDFVNVFHTSTWKFVSQFKVPTVNAAGLLWGASSLELVVWDHGFEHRLHCYYLEGTHLFTHEVKKPISMGLQCVSWSPDNQILALGHHLHSVYLINRTNRKVFGELVVPELLNGEEVQYYREVHTSIVGDTIMERLNAVPEHKFEVVTDRSIDLRFEEVPVEKKKGANSIKEKPPRRCGVTAVRWSHDSSHLAVLDSSRPNVITIWNIADLNVLTAVLELNSNVKSFTWHPHLLRLVVGSGEHSLCMWESDGSWVIQLPAECAVNVNNISWSSVGDSLILGSKESHCIGFLE